MYTLYTHSRGFIRHHYEQSINPYCYDFAAAATTKREWIIII